MAINLNNAIEDAFSVSKIDLSLIAYLKKKETLFKKMNYYFNIIHL